MTTRTKNPRPKRPVDRPTKLRPADPDRRDGGDTMAAGTVLLVIIGSLAAAALLNAGPMLERAQTTELGTGRDVRIAIWEPIEAISSSLGLGLPRRALDGLGDSDGPASVPAGVDIVAGGQTRETLRHEPLDVPPAAPATANGSEPSSGENGDGITDAESVGTAGPIALPPIDRSAGDAGTSPTATPLGLPSLRVPAGDGLPGGDDSSTAEGAKPAQGAEGEVNDPADDDPPAELDAGRAEAGASQSPPSPFPLRRPTVDDPLRLLIVGDSTMDAVGNAILRELTTSGLTEARLDFRVSTGLSRPDFFDWPAHLRELRATDGTEVIVMMIGANDAQPILADGTVEQHGSERWSQEYRRRVSQLLDELTEDEGWVIWIGQPAMRNDPYDARLRGLNQIYAEETARYPNAVYVDPRPVTSAEDGRFSAYLPDADGNQELIRQSDGVHLTSDGGDRISPLVVEEINRIAPLF